MTAWWVYGLAATAAALLVLSFAPLPGYYNAAVTVDSYEVGVLVGAVFGISSVNAAVTGPASILDWQGLGLSFTFGVNLAWTMTVCLTGPSQHCSSKSTDQWFGSLPGIGSQVTAADTFDFGYVPSGSYGVTVTLTGNGQSASASSSLVVG